MRVHMRVCAHACVRRGTRAQPVRPRTEGHQVPSNEDSPAEGGQALPAHLSRTRHPTCCSPNPGPHPLLQPLLRGTGGFSPSCSSDVFHTVSFCSSTKPRWDSLDFLTALSPAYSYYQQRKRLPHLCFASSPTRSKPLPWKSTESHAAEPRPPDPCLRAGRGETPATGLR